MRWIKEARVWSALVLGMAVMAGATSAEAATVKLVSPRAVNLDRVVSVYGPEAKIRLQVAAPDAEMARVKRAIKDRGAALMRSDHVHLFIDRWDCVLDDGHSTCDLTLQINLKMRKIIALPFGAQTIKFKGVKPSRLRASTPRRVLSRGKQRVKATGVGGCSPIGDSEGIGRVARARRVMFRSRFGSSIGFFDCDTNQIKAVVFPGRRTRHIILPEQGVVRLDRSFNGAWIKACEGGSCEGVHRSDRRSWTRDWKRGGGDAKMKARAQKLAEVYHKKAQAKLKGK